MNRFFMTCGVALFLAACVALLPLEAYGQKKKAPPKKTEEAAEAPTPAPAPAPAAMPLKGGASLKEVLMKFKGEKTNLGVLSKVEGDYFVTEDKGAVTYRAIGAIISIEVLKTEDEEEEEGGQKLDIQMMR
jgi:hypothetical protein